MTTPHQHDDPNAYSLLPVSKGDTYCRAVEGGVRRTPAPAEGLVVVLADREVFIPRAEVDLALGQLAARAIDATPGKPRR